MSRIGVLGLFILLPATVWGEESPPKLPAWVVQFAVAQESVSPNDKIELSRELEHARSTFEKLAEKTAFRKFTFQKESVIENPIAGEHRVRFQQDLFMDFELESTPDEHLLHAVWLRKAPGPEEKFDQVGGKVKKPYSPGRSLVILGPKIEEGVAVAIIRLEKEREKE